MTKTCTAIVPFYNEKGRIETVLAVLTGLKNFSQIICVDDGSTDDASVEIREQYPQIELVRLKKNLGKSNAIAEGLKKATSDYIFLLDADLQNLRREELALVINQMLIDLEIDMIIMRRKKPALLVRLIRGDILFSGERILKKKDLIEVFKTNPVHYQIESAINKYMLENHKRVFWYPSSIHHTVKIIKSGLVVGGLGELISINNILSYDFSSSFSQMMRFCHQRIS